MALQNNNGCQSTVITANTAGTQIFFSGVSTASTSVPTGAQGLLHSISIGADTTANTITCYDGTSTSGTKKFQILTPTTVPVTQLFIDIQFTTGLFFVLSGGSTINITLAWL